jgi:hypothetical protein
MKSRRGLSTVVGAVFFVIAATTVITYISYSMNSIDEFAQSVIVSEAENINRGMEEISIPQATIVGGEFNATVINTGSLPIQLTRLWVIDEDSGLNSKADLDIMINPGNQKYNIGQGTGITADSATSYTLKAVTSRGNIATFTVSPDISTQTQIIMPSRISPNEEFRVVSIITNNSTLPNNIANLVPIIANNETLTQVQATTPPSVAVLPQGNSVTFSSSWIAPEDLGDVEFMANYTGAPSGAGINSTISVAISSEAEAATNSQWSQAASRVGILISGIPNPISSAGGNTIEYGKWGIGIINPLDRVVDVYSVGIMSSQNDLFSAPGQSGVFSTQSVTDGWEMRNLGDRDLVVLEYGDSPAEIAEKSVAQFTVEFDLSKTGSEGLSSDVIISALTSEGKLSATYNILTAGTFPLINAFYSTDVTNPATAASSWTYILEGLNSNTNYQFNATVQNVGSRDLGSKVTLIILVPAGFDNLAHVTSSGWDTSEPILENPDNSHIIKVTTSASDFTSSAIETYKFTADTPTVTDDKLYVFQTTTVYPTFGGVDGESQLTSALSEAGVEVIP